MAIDVSRMKMEGLVALKGQIEERMVVLQEEAAKAAIKEMEGIAERAGMTLKDLVGKYAKGKRKGNRRPATIKFRNPANSEETWTGRGRQPKWVEREVASGKRIEDLAIAGSAP